MKYERIKTQNYVIHLINTDRFKTVNIDVTFSNKFNKNDIAYLSMLIKMLVFSTEKHKTTQSLAILSENLYGVSLYSSFQTLGYIEKLSLSIEFLNPKYTEDSMLKKSINLLGECIFNPHIENNKFNEQNFKINKNSLTAVIKSIADDSYSHALIKFKEQMYKTTPAEFNLYNNMKLIDDLKNTDLYNFYCKMLAKSKIDVFVVGNLDDNKKYVKYINQMLSPLENNFNSNDLSLLCEDNKISRKTIKEKGNFIQSQLIIGYNFSDLTEYEKKYVLYFYNSLLGGVDNSILFTEVREKNSLCYTIHSSVTKNPYSIRVETEIDKSNYQKTVLLIDKAIKTITTKNTIKHVYIPAKENINIALNSFYDNKTKMVDHYYKKEFSSEDDIETSREKFMNVSLEDIINLNKKIHKAVTYFLEGGKN